MNQAAWIEEGQQLYRAHANSQFVIGDWVNVGIQAFGRTPAFDAAQQITGTKHTRNFFTRCAAVAGYYPASLRFPLQFHTYEVLKRFPLDFLSTFLPEVAKRRPSCAQIYSLAVEQYGEDPRLKRKAGKFHAVRLPERLYQSLAARAEHPHTTHLLVAKILEEWEQQQQSAGKDAVGARPSDFSAPSDTQTRPETSAEESTPRPTYSERRAAQRRTANLAAKRNKTRTEISFITCKGRSEDFVDTENGTVKIPKMKSRATCFHSFEDALAGAREYSEAKRYVVIPYTCPSCSNGKPVWHLRYPEEVDLSKEQAEVRATVQDFIQSTRASWRQQHAQA